jgi:tetratricopeptide (TPR) repeat protein
MIKNINDAIKLREQQLYKDSLEVLNGLDDKVTEKFVLEFEKGLVHRLMGNIDIALDHLLMCSELNPNHVQAYNEIGIALRNKGDVEKSFFYIRKALKISPNNLSANFEMANNLLQQNDVPQAQRHLEILLKDHPNFEPAKHLLLQIYEAEKEWEKSVILNKSLTNTSNRYLSIAKIKALHGEFAGAYELVIKTLLNKESNIATGLRLGDIYRKAGNRIAALDIYETLLTMEPSNKTILYELAIEYLAIDLPDKSLQLFDKLLEVDSNFENAKSAKELILFALDNCLFMSDQSNIQKLLEKELLPCKADTFTALEKLKRIFSYDKSFSTFSAFSVTVIDNALLVFRILSNECMNIVQYSLIPESLIRELQFLNVQISNLDSTNKKLVILLQVSSQYTDALDLWINIYKRKNVGFPLIIVALDDVAYSYLSNHETVNELEAKIFCVNFFHRDVYSYGNGKSQNFYWYLKLKIVRIFLKYGFDVIQTDVDAFWVDDISEYINEMLKHGDKDILIQYGSGHPKFAFQSWGLTVCAGFFAIKSNSKNLHFMNLWISNTEIMHEDQNALCYLIKHYGTNFEEKSGEGKGKMYLSTISLPYSAHDKINLWTLPISMVSYDVHNFREDSSEGSHIVHCKWSDFKDSIISVACRELKLED